MSHVIIMLPLLIYLSELNFYYKEFHQDISHYKLRTENSQLLIMIGHLYQKAENHLHNYLIVNVIVLLARLLSQRF
jgi:hypothetical protein